MLVNKTKLPLIYAQWEEDFAKPPNPFPIPKGAKYELRENEQVRMLSADLTLSNRPTQRFPSTGPTSAKSTF